MSPGLSWDNSGLGLVFCLCRLMVDGSAPISHHNPFHTIKDSTDLENESSPEGLCEHLLEYVKPGPGIKAQAPEVLLAIFQAKWTGAFYASGRLSPLFWVHLPGAKQAGFSAPGPTRVTEMECFQCLLECAQMLLELIVPSA